MSDRVINVYVRNKIARAEKTLYVCGNSDYIVQFDFDAEWDAHEVKTARFIGGGVYQDVVFSGNECPVPIMSNTYSVKIGVFAGNLRTTTPASVPAEKSILCGIGSPAAPSPDVYAQIMELLNQKGDGGEGGQCGCEQATNEEVLEVLLEMDAVPAVTVNGSPLTIDNNIVML